MTDASERGNLCASSTRPSTREPGWIRARPRGAARRAGSVVGFLAAAVFAATPIEAAAEPEEAHPDLGEVGAKLSNPLSELWALFTEFDVSFSDGNANSGDEEIGSLMNFQPIAPIPLYGEGTERWSLITRPAVPIAFSVPRPTGFDEFDREAGLGDILLPLVLVPPLDNPHVIFGLGPTFTLPTATNVHLTRRQWQAGPAVALGYKTSEYVVGIFPQYFFGIGGRGDQGSAIDDASQMNLLYFAFFNLPNAWQIGTNPVITYDRRASAGNRWNVPIGITAAKTLRLGGLPVKVQLGVEYSVVSQDAFGRRAGLKLNLIPVVPAPISRPVLGGGP